MMEDKPKIRLPKINMRNINLRNISVRKIPMMVMGSIVVALSFGFVLFLRQFEEKNHEEANEKDTTVKKPD